MKKFLGTSEYISLLSTKTVLYSAVNFGWSLKNSVSICLADFSTSFSTDSLSSSFATLTSVSALSSSPSATSVSSDSSSSATSVSSDSSSSVAAVSSSSGSSGFYAV